MLLCFQEVDNKKSFFDQIGNLLRLVSGSYLINIRKKMYIPGCIEHDIRYRAYRGKVAYKKVITLKERGYYRLIFKGVSHSAKVYINGGFVKEHYNAYTTFDVIFEAVESDIYTIEVLVSNELSADSALHIPNDYYTYGGIIKPVVIEKLSTTYIKQLQWTTQLVDNIWQIKLLINLQNLSGSNVKNQLIEHENVKLNMQNIYELIRVYLEDVQLKIESINVEWRLEDNKEELLLMLKWSEQFDINKTWSNQNPKLFFLKVELLDENKEKIVDDLIERVGYRDIQVRKKQLFLNGEALFLKGVNRHEDYNSFGCALPTQAMAIDLALIKDLACNTVRTSHYPNDERFLDMCDELGLFVWEENHARGLSLENMQHKNFDEQCKNCNEEMVLQHYNHPSIIIWGILNECASHTIEGRTKYANQLQQIRTLDSSRPLTFASCQHFADLCFDLVDIVSTNIYFGWYDESRNVEEIRHEFEKQLDWIKEANGKDKPLIISEFGAGALYGYRAPHAPKWSEERQADILRDTLSIYQNHQDVCGTYIWQFCDVRVTEEEWAMKRPRSMNNKGIVDEYRRPKLAYDVVKKMQEKNRK